MQFSEYSVPGGLKCLSAKCTSVFSTRKPNVTSPCITYSLYSIKSFIESLIRIIRETTYLKSFRKHKLPYFHGSFPKKNHKRSIVRVGNSKKVFSQKNVILKTEQFKTRSGNIKHIKMEGARFKRVAEPP